MEFIEFIELKVPKVHKVVVIYGNLADAVMWPLAVISNLAVP